MPRPSPAGALAVLLVAGLGSGCGLLFREDPASAPDPDAPTAATPAVESGSNPDTSSMGPPDSASFPGGHGTLRQEEISMTLERGELQMLVTPLAEEVTRTAAPDTWERLSSLDRAHRSSLRERTGAEAVQLFLVGLHSENQAVAFVPEDLTIVSRGLRFRPLEIRGLTPGWDRHRVGPRETLLAIYAFPWQIDLEREIELEYQEIRSRDWESVLPRIQAERGRIQARSVADSTLYPSIP